MRILLIHGPNLNLLGEREPEKYGHLSSEGIVDGLKKNFPQEDIQYFQSNTEGEIVNAIQQARGQFDGLLINAGAFSHTSIAIADAIRGIQLPCIGVHITDIYQREAYRHTDLVGEACSGCIAGLGTEGYALAFECLLDKLNNT